VPTAVASFCCIGIEDKQAAGKRDGCDKA